MAEAVVMARVEEARAASRAEGREEARAELTAATRDQMMAAARVEAMAEVGAQARLAMRSESEIREGVRAELQREIEGEHRARRPGRCGDEGGSGRPVGRVARCVPYTRQCPRVAIASYTQRSPTQWGSTDRFRRYIFGVFLLRYSLAPSRTKRAYSQSNACLVSARARRRRKGVDAVDASVRAAQAAIRAATTRQLGVGGQCWFCVCAALLFAADNCFIARPALAYAIVPPTQDACQRRQLRSTRKHVSLQGSVRADRRSRPFGCANR